MALQKEIITKSGVKTLYHRVTNVSLGHDKMLSCDVESFVSKEYATDNNYIITHTFIFENISQEEEESMGIRQLSYKKIKETKEWSDALDC